MSPRADAVRNRKRVLQAAQEAFDSEGLAVSMPEIARRAGVGVGTLYRHFPDKEALFEAVLVAGTDAVIERAQTLIEMDDPGSALFTFLRGAALEGARSSGFKGALARAGYDVDSATSSATARITELTHALLEGAKQAGTVRRDITVADLFALLGGVLQAPRQESDQAALERLLSVVLNGLRPGPTA